MAKKNKEDKSREVLKNITDNKCPDKEGDNCKVPGIFNDSEPIGGS